MPGRQNNQTAIAKTKSERLFEGYLTSTGVSRYDYHPHLPGSGRRPDYRLFVGEERVLCAVAEFESPVYFESALQPRSIHLKLTEKIQHEWGQLKDSGNDPCCIVFHGIGQRSYLTKGWWIWGALLGEIKFFSDRDPHTGLVRGEPGLLFSPEGSQMVWDTGEARKGNLSAVVALELLDLGQRGFLASLPPYPQLSRLERALRNLGEECRGWGTPRDSRVKKTRVVVHRNPLTKTPLPPQAFSGPCDEHYSYFAGWPGRVERTFVGEELKRLEAEERRVRRNGLPWQG